MQVFWSRYQPRAHWALWVLFAHRHVDPTVYGVMFDIGGLFPNNRHQRQGAAVFGDTIADNVEPGEENPSQWIARRRLFTAVHEIGHCFNLLHSYEKHQEDPWVGSLVSDPQALSFMNRPERVTNFFERFDWRFDPQELYFIRHAPEEFVQMGGAAAGENHGDRGGPSLGPFPSHPSFAFELGVNRATSLHDFLQPVTVDLKLTNVSSRPQLVESSVLDDSHNLALFVRRRGGTTQRWQPFTRHCFGPGLKLLQPGESIIRSLFVSGGLGGWYIAEPGAYSIHASVSVPGGAVFAQPVSLRVALPQRRDEEVLAQDFFTDEVAEPWPSAAPR